MKASHLITSLDQAYGGPATALVGLASHLACDVQIAYGRGTGPWVPGATELRTQRIAYRSGVATGDAKQQMAAVVRGTNVVHIHGVWENIQYLGASAARSLEIPYVIRTCGMLDPWSLRNRSYWKKRLYLAFRLRKMLRHATAIHFTTRREADLAVRFTRPEQVVIEPNGLDLADYESLPKRGYWRGRLGIDESPLILFLSRIAPKKGLDLLIPAISALKDTSVRLIVAGPDEGGYCNVVQRIVAEHGIQDRVFFVGPLEGERKRQAYVDADLFALTSYQENFGNVVLESWACGTPVLVSDQVNLCDEVLGNDAGYVVPMEHSEVVKMLNDRLQDRKLLTKAGANGRKLAFDKYSWSSIANRWVSRYLEWSTK